MAYLQQQDANRKIVTIGAVAAIHGVAIWALVTGLAPDVFRQISTVLEGRNIPVAPPPPPPTPPDTRDRTTPDDKPAYVPVPDVNVPRSGPIFDPIPEPLPQPDPLPAPQPTLAPAPDPEPSFTPRAARPMGRPGLWVSPSDYPARDLREGNQGVTRFSLSIGADGRIGSCVVTQSSGHAGLDEATCRNLARRARFAPATDETGARVSGSYTGSIRWEIPRD